VLRDRSALDYAVKAKIYPEDPDSMVVTTRRGGLAVFDVSAPGRPTLRTHWRVVSDVEGQDRQGDLLVVVARAGSLHTFDASDPGRLRHLAELELETDPALVEAISGSVLQRMGNPFHALHTKLYRADDGLPYALVSAPTTKELIAVDVSDPERPVQVGAVDTKIQLIEGIYVHRGHAFVGGFGRSQTYSAVDVSDPRSMRVVASLSDPAYRQMVSEMHPGDPHLLYAALWDDPGGLAIFDVEDPPHFREVGAILRSDLAHANRVKLDRDSAFLPLEQDPGGFAIVDVAKPEAPELVSLVRDIPDVTEPYTLAINRDHLYVFGTREASMAVFRLERGEPEHAFSLWNFGPGDADTLAAGRRAADAGRGALRLLDPGEAGPRSTQTQLRAGSEDRIGYLEIAPSGVWTRDNGIVLEHGLTQTFHGGLPHYTLVWDLQVPSAGFALNGCHSQKLLACDDVPLYQLDRSNSDDAELFLKVGATPRSQHGFVGKTGDPVSGAGGLGGYAEGIRPGRWHRLALVVDLCRQAGQASIYIDGERVHEANGVDYAGFASLAEAEPDPGLPVRNGFLLFADEDGEMRAPVRLSSLLFVNRAYGPDEVAALGPPGPEGIPAP
jgi:hypothetical protein